MRSSYRILLALTALFSILGGCDKAKPKDVPVAPASQPTYRYFDREVFFASGSSVSPEQTVSQEIARAALEDLELASDLGAGYFIFSYADDSLLQPIAASTQSNGRLWQSFIQTWDDYLINNYLTTAGVAAPDADQDVIVGVNTLNFQQFFVIARLSCFLSGESCGFASPVQAKMLVWRAFGYKIGMRVGEKSSSAVMKPSINKDQENPEEQRRFLAEFNNQLEAIKNKNPAVSP